MRDFRKLEIWKESIKFVTQIYEIYPFLYKQDRFGLASQITRAAVSIPSNISEGCRGSNKELIHFLNIALGSSFELETQLIIINNVMGISEGKITSLLVDVQILQKRINAYRSYIYKQNPSQYPNTPIS